MVLFWLALIAWLIKRLVHMNKAQFFWVFFVFYIFAILFLRYLHAIFMLFLIPIFVVFFIFAITNIYDPLILKLITTLLKYILKE